MKYIIFSLLLLVTFCLQAENIINLTFENGFEGWTVVDNDDDGKQWEITDDPDAVHNGAYGAQVEYNRDQNDDWLISPQLSIPYNRIPELKFWAKSSSHNLPESFRIMISTGTDAVSNFTNYIGGETEVPDTWTEYTYDLASYQGSVFYIGIQCNSEDQAFFYIDDIRVNIEVGPGVDGWLKSNNSIAMDFESVFFTTENTGFACGLAGAVTSAYKSVDGGVQWAELDVSTTNSNNRYLRDIYFKNNLVGFMFGGYGNSATIIKTEDGGTSWSEAVNDAEGYVTSATFTDDMHGFATLNTGNILETTDGGSNWTQRDIGNMVHLYSIFFANSQVGYISGRLSTVFKTSDGGQNWTEIDLGLGNYDLYDLYFLDADTGYITAGPNLYYTTDGGLSWDTRFISGNTHILKSIEFADMDNGWVSGTYGTIYKTGYGGASWHSQPSGCLKDLNDIFCLNNTNTWIGGNEGTILYSVTGGGVDNDENTVEKINTMEASNYPNPFNPSTTISFSVKDARKARVDIYNVRGQKVYSFDNIEMKQNSGQVVWNGTDHNNKTVGTGVYFYKITTDNKSILTKKMVLIK